MFRVIRQSSLLVILMLLMPVAARAGEPYTFDLAETEKRPYRFGGYAEFRPVVSGLDRDSALYRLQYFDRDRATLEEWNARLQLEGSYEAGAVRLYLKTNTDYRYSSFTAGSERSSVFEGYGTVKPSDTWKFEIGKKNLRWGKGYAWNPVNFFDRSKDPNDPEVPIEGNIMATADYVRSFDGPLKTFSITPVLFPVYDHLNDDFGVRNRLNVGGKISLLLYDTDVDLIYVADGSRTARLGVDFSRNVTTSFEVHGELALIRDDLKPLLDPSGAVQAESGDAISALIGIRHLTTFDLTTIFEYYHNGTGFTPGAMERYFGFIQQGYEEYRASGSLGMLTGAQTLAARGYGRNNPMTDYLYLRMSQKEPLDILYFTPSVTVMANLNDRSHTITPEVLYTGITNLELRLRFGWTVGGRGTEFGEKQNDYRFELRVGYYF